MNKLTYNDEAISAQHPGAMQRRRSRYRDNSQEPVVKKSIILVIKSVGFFLWAVLVYTIGSDLGGFQRQITSNPALLSTREHQQSRKPESPLDA